jgi:hypothetical protein
VACGPVDWTLPEDEEVKHVDVDDDDNDDDEDGGGGGANDGARGTHCCPRHGSLAFAAASPALGARCRRRLVEEPHTERAARVDGGQEREGGAAKNDASNPIVLYVVTREDLNTPRRDDDDDLVVAGSWTLVVRTESRASCRARTPRIPVTRSKRSVRPGLSLVEWRGVR